MVDYSRQINPMDVGSYVQQGFEQGRQRGHATYLNRLAGEAYAAPPEQRQGYLAKLIGADAQTGTAMAAHLDAADEGKYKQMGQWANLIVNTPPELQAQVWQTKVAPGLRTMGLQVDDAWSPEYLPMAQSLAQTWGSLSGGPPAGYQEFDLLTKAGDLSPEDRARAARVRLGLDGRASSAGFGFTVEEDAYGNPRERRRNPRTGAVEVFYDETGQWVPLGSAAGAQPPPVQQPTGSAPGNYADVQGTLEAIGQKYGFRTTSTVRTRAENDSLPGSVSNSQHLAENGGTARDFSIQGKSPQEVSALVSELQRAGFEVVADNHGTAPHIHAELPPGRAPVAAGGDMSPPGYGGGSSDARTPVGSPAPVADPYANSPYLRTNIQDVGGGAVVPGLGRGRRAEDKAAAEEAAKRRVALQFAPEEATAAADAARQKKEAELLAERTAARDKRGEQAGDTIATLRDALTILPQATGGAVGQVRDAAGRLVNQSTEGSRATARLKLLAAKLIANVPRFEGPQSNIDVQFYREAAGDLANPDLSVGERTAAAELMLEIAERYANQDGAPAAPAAPVGADGWGMTRVK